MIAIEKPRRMYCQCCGRQIVNRDEDSGVAVGSTSVAPKVMVGGFCCHQCGYNLDEFGLFPEERKE